jgi:hypothetical protein
MKKLSLLLVAFFFLSALHAQDTFEKVDSFAQNFKKEFKDPSELAKELTAPFTTDREKARAIYTWVASNIRYDLKKFKSHKGAEHFRAKNKQELEKKMQEAREHEIVSTLRNKKGVCEDYSMLVEKMCDAVGLECEVVSGNDRSLRGHSAKHAWNAIKFDSTWHLVDATWGAGYVDDDEGFVKLFTPAYFNTDPAMFILNHLPKESKWQLLNKPVTPEAFSQQPIINYGNGQYTVLAFTPVTGRLKPVQGKAEIRIRLEKIPEVFVVAANGTREVASEVKAADDNWTVLTFSPEGTYKFSVYGGKTKHKAVLLGQFTVE